ncbi:MAG: indole-3-glycerol phosphate synthase TrpC [Gemmataceae bacterium]
MVTILDTIVASKREELAEAKRRTPERELEQRAADAPPPRPFQAALERNTRMGIIAEIKKASPSAGILREDFDPVAIASLYAENGADCLSILTDAPFFQGHLEYLRAVRQAVALPLLRKDFIVDRYQILEARAVGADAVLLIAEVLPDPLLTELLSAAREIGMEALVELHDANQLDRVVASGANLIGINNRDLRTFVTRLDHTLELAPRVPTERCLVSESGIRTRADMDCLHAAGVKAVLVGESLMRAPDIGLALRQLAGREYGPPA